MYRYKNRSYSDGILLGRHTRAQAFLSLVDQYWSPLSSMQKLGAMGAAAAVIVGVPWLVYTNFLSRDAKLSSWNENYKELCYGPNHESDFNSDFSGYSREVRSVLHRLEKTYLGEKASENLTETDTVFCFDEPPQADYDYKYDVPESGQGDTSPKAIEHWRIANVYIIPENATYGDITNNIFMRFTDVATDRTAEWSADYTPESALFWARSITANYYTTHVDNMYRTEEFFESQDWKAFEQNPQFGHYARIYREAFENDISHDGKNARLAVFEAVMTSPETAAKEDEFLRWYRGKLADVPRTVTYPCGTDSNGNIKTCTRTEYDPPPRSRNSMELKPETLVTMTNAFFADGDGYMNLETAARLLRQSSYSLPQTEAGLERWEGIKSRIDRCCDRWRSTRLAKDGLRYTTLDF